MRKTIQHCLLVLLSLALLASCRKESGRVFPESASKRISNTLAEAEELLTTASHGWHLVEFAGTSEKDYGGMNFAVSFTKTEVTAYYERDTLNAYTSHYSLVAGDCAMLSFDSYNPHLHLYSTPSTTAYEAKGGDFQFAIVSLSPQEIILRGIRTGKMARMFPLDEPCGSFIRRIAQASDSFIVAFIEGTLGGRPISGSFDLNNRQLHLTEEGAVRDIPYVTTLSGIRFYEPLKIGQSEFETLDFDPATFSFSSNGEILPVVGSLPDDYVPYDAYEGNYVFNYWNDSALAHVTLTPGIPNETYILSGISRKYSLTLTYDKASGSLSLNSQKIGDDGTRAIWLCAWDANAGYLSWSKDAGMHTVWNQDSEHPVYSFVSNEYDFLPNANSFILWLIDENNASAGQFEGNGWDPYNRSVLPFLGNLTRKENP
ncbi:MAG: DUF4302 domain-containing protein [Bacteroidales bacterium]|nr:DUF4302 domain-containing protein [Bacteroidales bacterium]